VYLLKKSCGETFAAHDAIPKNLWFELAMFNEIFWNDTASICAQFAPMDKKSSVQHVQNA